MKNNIVLIGMMGSGKTTLGKFLAMILGFSFIDLDKEIELQAGKTISDIFADEGEEFFRNFEHLLLKKILENENAVISTGGGIIELEENIELLKAHKNVFYLEAPVDVLWTRIAGNNSRPNLKNFEKFEALLTRRKSKYEQTAKHVINANRTLSEIASEIKGIL